jgi:hypothetical protein
VVLQWCYRGVAVVLRWCYQVEVGRHCGLEARGVILHHEGAGPRREAGVEPGGVEGGVRA